MRADQPLALDASIFLDALRGETLLLFPRRAGPEFYDEIIAACHRAGFTPAKVVDVPQLTSMPAFVAAGIGLAILPRSLSSIAFEAVRYLQIRGNAPVAPLALIVAHEPSNGHELRSTRNTRSNVTTTLKSGQTSTGDKSFRTCDGHASFVPSLRRKR